MIPNGQGKSLKVELNRLKEHCKRTEKSYSDTEQRFRLATQATGLGIWEWNVLTDRIRWDQQMFCLYGIPPTEDGLVSYQDWSRAVLPEDLPAQEQMLRDTIRSKGQNCREFRIRRQDNGQYRDIQAVEMVRLNVHGQVEWVVGTNLDITEQKRAKERLESTNALLKSITSETEDMIAAQDQDFRYIFFNEAYRDEIRRLWGVELELGMCMVDMLAPWPKDQRKAIELWGRALQGESFTITMEFGPTGRERQIYDLQFNPLHDARGHQTGAAHIIRNITERKLTESALRESEIFYRQTLESIPGMVFISRPDGYCNYISRQWTEYTGSSREEQLGDGWLHVLHPEDKRRASDAWQEAIQSGLPYDVIYRIRRKGGDYEWFKAYGSPIRNESGQIVRWFGTVLNIHQLVLTKEQLQQAKQEAEQANHAKSEFLANMSHEIRTPMTIFMMALEHLLQIDHNPERRKLIEMAEQSAERLRSLIDDLLDFSRIEANKLELEKEPFDIRSCFQEAVSLFSMPAHEKGLLLKTEVVDNVPENVSGDKNRVGQILINLLSNAVKFTEKGQIRISLRVRGRSLEFSVADTGIGIPQEKRHLLFKSFSQADGSFMRRYGGTGLGLAISKKLAELMGGDISFSSQKDQGSVFTFTLPLEIPEQLHLPFTDSRNNAPASAPATYSILLAEDEPMIREMIALLLSQKGQKVDFAENGQLAVEKWKSGAYDLILMDLQMPEMNGLEATRRIREIERKGKTSTYIVGLTAHARKEITDACLAAGMNGVLTKPLRMKELFKTIESCGNKGR